MQPHGVQQNYVQTFPQNQNNQAFSPARSPGVSDPAQNDGTKLIVNYIPDTVNETVLYNLFVHYGEIESVRVMRDQAGNPKGYGFVKYTDTDSAIEAIQMLNGLEIGHKRIKVGYCRPGGSRSRSNLFVGSLPYTWTEEDLIAMFTDFKPIIDVRILRETDGTSKRCGFVRLDSEIKANLAIQKFHKAIINGHPIQVSIANNKKNKRLNGSVSPSPTTSLSPAAHSPQNTSPTITTNQYDVSQSVFAFQNAHGNMQLNIQPNSPQQPVEMPQFPTQPLSYVQVQPNIAQPQLATSPMLSSLGQPMSHTNINLTQGPTLVGMPTTQHVMPSMSDSTINQNQLSSYLKDPNTTSKELYEPQQMFSPIYVSPTNPEPSNKDLQ